MSPAIHPDLRGGRTLFVLLVLLSVILSGCTAVLPAKTPPDDVPNPGPQLVCETTWHDNETVTITVRKGPRVEPGPGEAIAVRLDTAAENRNWVAGESHSSRAQPAPLVPGDSITVGIEPGTDHVSVIWTVTDEYTARRCESDRPREDAGDGG